MKFIYLSSNYEEFAEERQALHVLLESSSVMRDSFSLINPETQDRAESPFHSYFSTVDKCDIFLALLGRRYGPTETDEASAIDLEFRRAREQGKICLVFVKGHTDEDKESRMQAFLRRVGSQVLFRRYNSIAELRRGILDALSSHTAESVQNLGKAQRPPNARVFFGFERHPGEELTITFSPRDDDWNDFSLRTRFDYHITGLNDLPVLTGHLYLGFLSNEERWRSPAAEIMRLLEQSARADIPGSDLPQFFTMLESIQDYRTLVGQFGPERAENLLLVLNDVVAHKQTKSPQWLKQAFSTDAFNLAFLRKSESFFAFHNAGSVLAGLNEETIHGISTTFRLTFQLPTFRNPHHIRFSFDHSSLLPKRIAVVIGKNGVGKSQTLSHFTEALITGDGTLLGGDIGSRPSVNRLVAISSPGETYTTFPSIPIRHTRIDYRRIYLSKRQYGGRDSGLGETLIQLARSEETIRGQSRWDLFCEIVSIVIPVNEVFIETRGERSRGRPSVRRKAIPVPLPQINAGGERSRLERWASIDPLSDGCRFIEGEILPLSSGQITFLRFAAQTCLNIEKGTMLLFDEPETHLHPNLIGDFVRLLDRLLTETGSFAILATHSAYFIREVPRSQVLILRTSTNGITETVPARLKTLGADIGAISAFIFEDEGYGALVRQLAQELRKEGGGEELLQSLEEELPAETIMHLRDAIANSGAL